jgi:hypothetical protein
MPTLRRPYADLTPAGPSAPGVANCVEWVLFDRADGQNLVDEIVDDEAVAPGEGLDERSDVSGSLGRVVCSG